MNTSSRSWVATREAGLAVLSEFLPRAGSSYAHQRNFERGRGNHRDVSGLSPWISLRVLSEQEVVDQVLAIHSFDAAKKFIDEVCWRTYWKGWLQLRPWVWDEFVSSLDGALHKVQSSEQLAARYQQLLNAETGIEAVDEWLLELYETGYLHNHSRMWLASLWVFWFKLPWELGAALFYRYLLDADAASNTLSWRWVAGLHTNGKRYIPDAEGIAHWTEGRVTLSNNLFQEPDTLEPVQHKPPLELAPLPDSWQVSGAAALLLHEDDLLGGFSSEQLKQKTEGGRVQSVLAFRHPAQHQLLQPAPIRKAFVDEAAQGRAQEISDTFGVDFVELMGSEALANWRTQNQESTLLTVDPCAGEVSAALTSQELDHQPMQLIRRKWDSDFFPHATKGFFRFRKQIPKIIEKGVG